MLTYDHVHLLVYKKQIYIHILYTVDTSSYFYFFNKTKDIMEAWRPDPDKIYVISVVHIFRYAQGHPLC
jgi:hypothetical protein